MKAKKRFQKYGVLLLVLVMMMSLCACTGNTREAGAQAIAEARNGVVRIFAWDPVRQTGGTGSAFGVGTAGEETQYFVTNWHVVTSSGDFDIGEMNVYILLTNDAVTQDAQGYIDNIDPSQMMQCQVLYAADQYPDVAILKAERPVPGRVAMMLRSSQSLSIAEEVHSLGYPGVADVVSYSEALEIGYWYAGVDHVHHDNGTVSRLTEFEAFDGTYCVEHSAHINQGNSGGPLVDEFGNVVGINTYTLVDDDTIHYAVYVDYAIGYLDDLGIEFDYIEDLAEPLNWTVIALAIGAVVVLVVLLVVLLWRKPGAKAGGKSGVDTGLRVQYNGDAILAGKRYVISGTLRFGRAEDCNIRYPDRAPGVSGHHCEILVQKGQVYIRDLNSTHGTFVNGSRIPSNQQVPLSVGTRVSLGSQRESFQIVKSSKL